MAQVNFMARESFVRAQSGPESVYLGVTWIFCLGSESISFRNPVLTEAKWSLCRLMPLLIFYKSIQHPEGMSSQVLPPLGWSLSEC